MRRENTLALCLVAMFLLTAIADMSVSSSATTARLYVDPAEIIDPDLGPGSTFSVNVNVENVIDLYGWSVRLLFNPDIANVTNVEFTKWLSDESGWVAYPTLIVRNDIGFAYIGQMLQTGATNGANGTGTLATVTFGVEDRGVTALELYDSKLNTVIGGNNVPIDHDADDGVFDNRVAANQPPVAVFETEPLLAEANETITFNASASYDPDAWLVSYAWDFGDGTTETYLRHVNLTAITYHKYKRGGTYKVTLTVTDYDGATASATKDLAVGHDIAVTDIDVLSKERVGAIVHFNVTVENQGAFTENLNVTVSYDATLIGFNDTVILPTQSSTILSFDWETTGLTQGEYPINVTATIPTIPVDDDPTDNSKNTTIRIVEHDVAVTSVTSSPTSVKLGELVNITVVVENLGVEPETLNVTVYANENAIATENVTALLAGDSRTLVFEWNTTYADPGIYTISANATIPADDDPADNTFVDGTVVVGELPPVASFTYTPADPVVGETVVFDASTSYDPDGTIIDYAWDFGDNTTGTGNITTHAYDASGTYMVTLTVTDDSTAGLTDTAVLTVTVSRVELNVQVDVGSMHFRGEVAEFYVSVSRLGEPVDADIKATLYYADGTMHADLSASVESIALGLYRVPYTVPPDASAGNYVLVVEASLLTLKGTSLKSFLISETLTGWNALLVSINGTVGTIKTDVGLIKVKLDDINANIVSIEGNIATINSTIGLIQTDISTIDAKITSIDGILVTIETQVGVIKTDLDAVKSRITVVDGNIATIQTTLDAINGTITSIQDDIATIETEIGTIKTILEGWTGGTTSPITTPLGAFQILVLTTSALEGPIAFSDNVVAITLSGPSGTTGTTNVVIPKQLIVGIESSIDEIVVTVDDDQVIFAYTEQPEAYVLQITYAHSTRTIKVYLTGLPPTPFPWAMFIAILVVTVIAAVGIAIYITKIRKPRVAPASRSTATPDSTTLQP